MKVELAGMQALIDEQCRLKEVALVKVERLESEKDAIIRMMKARDLEAQLLQQRLQAMEQYRKDYESSQKELHDRLEQEEKDRIANHAR